MLRGAVRVRARASPVRDLRGSHRGCPLIPLAVCSIGHAGGAQAGDGTETAWGVRGGAGGGWHAASPGGGVGRAGAAGDKLGDLVIGTDVIAGVEFLAAVPAPRLLVNEFKGEPYAADHVR